MQLILNPQIHRNQLDPAGMRMSVLNFVNLSPNCVTASLTGFPIFVSRNCLSGQIGRKASNNSDIYNIISIKNV